MRLLEKVNKVFTTINLAIVAFVTLLGLANSDTHNWGIEGGTSANYTNPDGQKVGTGGFFPFGLSGTLAGAATCFYGFVGFDSIATSGEETINPQRAIPLRYTHYPSLFFLPCVCGVVIRPDLPNSIIASLAVVCLAYIGVSSSLTLMTPFYMQARWITFEIGGVFCR